MNTDPSEWIGPIGDLVGHETRFKVGAAGTNVGGATSFSFVDTPVRDIAEGDAWTSDWRLGGPALSGSMTVTVTAVNDDQVTVAFEGSGEGTKTYLEAPSARYKLVTAARVTGTAIVDRATGWVRTLHATIEAEGSIEFVNQGYWNGIRPLFSSDSIEVGTEMPTTYEITVEVTTIDG